jgi:hypothetical protein
MKIACCLRFLKKLETTDLQFVIFKKSPLTKGSLILKNIFKNENQWFFEKSNNCTILIMSMPFMAGSNFKLNT